MPRKFQNPKLEVRDDVKRHYYFIRVIVPGPDGKRQRINQALGFLDQITRKEAQKLRSAALDVVNAGKLLVQARLKFKDLVSRFVEARLPQFKTSTQGWQRSLIETHILPAFGDKQLADIDKQVVEAWLTGKEKEGLSWWTRKALRSVLSCIFTAAREWKLWSGDSPTIGVRIGRKRLVREKRLLTVDQLRALLAALSERPKFIVLIMFGLGLRISEVLGLRWSDIDWDAKQITIQRRWYRGDLSEEGETKSEASNAPLSLGPSMLQEFRSRYPGVQHRGEFVFIGDTARLPPDDRDMLREEFRPVLKRLGLYYPGFGWHAFRRQNITWRQQIGGATPLEAQRAARHASLDMTYLYTLNDAERETAQQQAMFDKLMEMPEGPKQ
jgi:integrase